MVNAGEGVVCGGGRTRKSGEGGVGTAVTNTSGDSTIRAQAEAARGVKTYKRMID